MSESVTTEITAELVANAYAALMSGDVEKIGQYWAEDMVWLVPGHNPLSGWYHGRDAFLGFMSEVGALSGNSFNMEPGPVMTGPGWSADVTHNVGYRASHEQSRAVPYAMLDIDVVHVLRWRDGKVVEGRGAIFGDGTTEYDQFWSPRSGREGERAGTGT